MSVLIKDMEMPENCAKCKLGEYEDMEWFSCPFLEDSYRHNAEFGRLDECPIVADIPDRHGRLIDADVLAAQSLKDGAYGYIGTKEIYDAPTIVEAE